ncbi:hypothetical protein ACNOYE_37775 [Nannocystaceae bacterium ST9]
MRAGPIALAAVVLLGCQAPPSRVEPDPTRELVPAEVEPAPVEAADPIEPAGPPGEDALLAEARASIVGGRIADEPRRRLADSTQPSHRRATRLLQAIAQEEPAAILVVEPTPEPVEPEPTPEPAPAEPDPRASDPALALEDDARIDELDPGRFSPDSAVASWLAGCLAIAPPDPNAWDPFAEFLAHDDPGVLLAIDRAGVLPRVILTRLDLVADPSGVVRLEIIGAGPVGVRVQPLSAHRLRVRVEEAGAMPAFVAARPSRAELAVTEVRRGRGCVEIDLELAPAWTPSAARGRSNGAELEFAITPAEPADPTLE